ncbi:hypothetical protein Btru_036945 [Bulinus truncatus]|nr:hypothetical protein Btru_036945 [Bulinus truncatus]
MAEILQAMRTFAMLHESETNIEEGQQKEFLRGTFSIMQFDENSKEQIDELKAKFMRYKKELGGLDIEEFKAALRPLTSKGISLNQILTTFRKMDPCDEEALTWNDFMNFAIEEHNKRMSMLATKDEMPFGPDVIQLKHNHRDPIIRITFMPTVDPITRLLDFGFGKYMILSREGLMSVWSMKMKPISYNNLVPRNTTDSGWYIDMVCLYHNGFICVATTARDLIFYDYTRAGWSRKYWLKKLSHSPTCLSYWAGMAQEQIAVLLWGDTSGTVRMIEFDLSQRLPMFGIPVKEGCSDLTYSDLQKGQYDGVTFRIFPHIHKDWVKEVKYIPQANSFASCCKDDNTALYMSHVEPSKKKPCYFHVLRGFLCFDFSYELNILAAAGIDCNIWLYNPYMPQKVVAMMEGHIRPVSHIKINEIENYCISVDLSKSIMIFNLSSQACIMRVPGQAVRMGNHFIYSVYLNSHRKMCLLGSYGLCLLKRHTLEGLSVEVRSHDHKLVGALYCPVFEQVCPPLFHNDVVTLFWKCPPLFHNDVVTLFWKCPPLFHNDVVTLFWKCPPLFHNDVVTLFWKCPPLFYNDIVTLFWKCPPLFHNDVVTLFWKCPPLFHNDVVTLFWKCPPLFHNDVVTLFWKCPPLFHNDLVALFMKCPPLFHNDVGTLFRKCPPLFHNDVVTLFWKCPPLFHNDVVTLFWKCPPLFHNDVVTLFWKCPPLFHNDVVTLFWKCPPLFHNDVVTLFWKCPPLFHNDVVTLFWKCPPLFHNDVVTLFWGSVHLYFTMM